MKWKKISHIFVSDNNYPWMHSHAANCVAENVKEDLFRIYFSSRDINNRAHISFVDVELIPPFEIVNICNSPVLSPGEIGTFDDSGVSLSCIKIINNKKYMYYLGWNLGVTVPWRNSIGLAILDEKTGKFEKYSQAPLLDRHHVDPFSISYPYVIEDNGIYRMWYGSNLAWGEKQEDMAHLIKYAESKDAIHWDRKGKVALNFKDETEYAMSRPFVLKENGIYKMWYSYRGKSYRIGYAESFDAINWIRKDELAGIDISPEGWDSETIEYPFIFEHKGKRYMLYNGNRYGKTGFGLAVLEK
jgi:hypothetical protein